MGSALSTCVFLASRGYCKPGMLEVSCSIPLEYSMLSAMLASFQMS